MKLKINTCLILFTLFFIPSVMAQQNNETPIREEVVFYTDRNLYLSGEDIWFKAMVTINNQSRKLSNILYLELYLNNKAVVKKKFQIVDGKVEGMLSIPEDINSANYYLRAYTQYQRNFAPETYFTSLLTIINPEIPIRMPKTRPLKMIEMIPEGGALLAGIPGHVAVRLNPGLLETIRQSWLTNQNSDKIDSVSFAANGLALIYLLPEDSSDYFLNFKLTTGDTISQALPNISHSGMLIREDWKNREINFYSTKAYRLQHQPAHTLEVFTIDGFKMLKERLDISKANETIMFDAGKLKAGIYLVKMSDSEGKTVAFTSFYKAVEGMRKVELSTQRNSFGRREKVELNMGSKFAKAGAKPGLTVAVVKKGTAPHFNTSLPSAIIDNPLLLSNYINQLDMGGLTFDRQIKAALILNRDFFNTLINSFDSEHEISDKTNWLPETRDVSLSGIVRNKKTKKVLPDVWVFASVLGNNAQFHAYKSREDGSFIFSLNQLNNTHELSVTIDSIPGIEAEFLIYNDFSDNWPASKDIPLQLDSSRRKLLENLFVNFQVAKMYQQKVAVEENLADTIPFPFTDVQASAKLKDFVALPTMREVLNELVPYVNVRKRQGKLVLAVVDQTRKNVYEHPLILVDNLPVFNVDEILAINPAKVERIDVIGKVYNFGDLLIEGIVMFYTKTDNFAGIQLPSASVFVEYQTITPSAAVRFPVYHPQSETAVHSPDFKNLLYWNPSLHFSNSDTTITFYTADEATEYEIIVKGKTADGRPVLGKCEIQVE